MNLINIAQGFINLAKKGFNISDEQVEELSKRRMKECISCIEYDSTNSSCTIEVFKGCCKLCGCYMEAKTRSIESKCSNKTNPKW